MDLHIHFANMIKDETATYFISPLLLYYLMFKMQLREMQKANNLHIPSNLYPREQCEYTAGLEVMMP